MRIVFWCTIIFLALAFFYGSLCAFKWWKQPGGYLGALLAVASIVLLILLGVAVAYAAPTISQIEAAFHLTPGATMPLVMPTGERVTITYHRIAHGRKPIVLEDGEYAIIVEPR